MNYTGRIDATIVVPISKDLKLRKNPTSSFDSAYKMGHVDMFWVYFIQYFAYIVSDEDCHVVYDLVRKLCELEGWRWDVRAGFTRRRTGILL